MLEYLLTDYELKKLKKITFDELRTYVLNEPDINKERGITVIKINETDSNITFRVEMRKNAKWNAFLADCLEVVIVYKGLCIDNASQREIHQKEQLIINPNIFHEIECLSDKAVLYVEFKNVKK